MRKIEVDVGVCSTDIKRKKEEEEEITNKLNRVWTYIVVNLRKNSNHKVEIGKSPSCGCADFVKNSGKELCKHIIWTLLNICRLPENSNLLHQLFLTDNEALSVVGNSYSVVPQNLMYKKGNNKTRKEIIQELLSNDPRSKNQQVWTLALKCL